jgi:hypothetical protein
MAVGDSYRFPLSLLYRQLQNKLWRFGERRHMFPSSIQVFCLSEIVEPESRAVEEVEAVVADYQSRKGSENSIDMCL